MVSLSNHGRGFSGVDFSTYYQLLTKNYPLLYPILPLPSIRFFHIKPV